MSIIVKNESLCCCRHFKNFEKDVHSWDIQETDPVQFVEQDLILVGLDAVFHFPVQGVHAFFH